jgi:hypothetical protein
MNRTVSLFDHARRRKSRKASFPSSDASTSSDSFEYDATGFENVGSGGVAHDAACFGAYDAPAPSRLPRARTPSRSGGALNTLFDGEHASYAAERCIGFDEDGHAAGRMPPPSQRVPPRQQRGIVAPVRGASYSNVDVDTEASYYHARNGSKARYNDAGSVAPGSMGGASVSGTTFSNGSNYNNGSYVSNASSDSSFVSVDVSSTMMLNPREEEQDAIRAGIRDISVFVATYLAGGLSLVIGELYGCDDDIVLCTNLICCFCLITITSCATNLICCDLMTYHAFYIKSDNTHATHS